MADLNPPVLLASLLYAGIGVLLFALVLVVVARLLPFSIRKEIEEDQNVALAVLIGAAFLGLAHIIAAAIS
jgi:uncharacterized membrane protein YjfL (UPF0719 family)